MSVHTHPAGTPMQPSCPRCREIAAEYGVEGRGGAEPRPPARKARRGQVPERGHRLDYLDSGVWLLNGQVIFPVAMSIDVNEGNPPPVLRLTLPLTHPALDQLLNAPAGSTNGAQVHIRGIPAALPPNPDDQEGSTQH